LSTRWARGTHPRTPGVNVLHRPNRRPRPLSGLGPGAGRPLPEINFPPSGGAIRDDDHGHRGPPGDRAALMDLGQGTLAYEPVVVLAPVLNGLRAQANGSNIWAGCTSCCQRGLTLVDGVRGYTTSHRSYSPCVNKGLHSGPPPDVLETGRAGLPGWSPYALLTACRSCCCFRMNLLLLPAGRLRSFWLSPPGPARVPRHGDGYRARPASRWSSPTRPPVRLLRGAGDLDAETWARPVPSWGTRDGFGLGMGNFHPSSAKKTVICFLGLHALVPYCRHIIGGRLNHSPSPPVRLPRPGPSCPNSPTRHMAAGPGSPWARCRTGPYMLVSVGIRRPNASSQLRDSDR